MSDLELGSQLYAWLGDRTSKPDGDAHDHESLLVASRDLAELVEARVQAAEQRAAVVGRCGNCDAITDTLPCPFCAANQRAVEAVKPGLSVESNGRRLAWFTDDELAAELNRRGAAAPATPAPEAPPCWCIACEHLTVRARTEAGDPLAMFARRFIVCPDCGNKRCPKATHHDLACTGSNEPGQPGSAYAQVLDPPGTVEDVRARIARAAALASPAPAPHAGEDGQ